MAVNRQTYTDDGKKTNSGKPKTETKSVTVGGRSVNVSVPTASTGSKSTKPTQQQTASVGGRNIKVETPKTSTPKVNTTPKTNNQPKTIKPKTDVTASNNTRSNSNTGMTSTRQNSVSQPFSDSKTSQPTFQTRKQFTSDREYENYIVDNRVDFTKGDAFEYVKAKAEEQGIHPMKYMEGMRNRNKNMNETIAIEQKARNGEINQNAMEDLNNRYGVMIDQDGNEVDINKYNNDVNLVNQTAENINKEIEKLNNDYTKGKIDYQSMQSRYNELQSMWNENQAVGQRLNNNKVLTGFDYYDWAKQNGKDVTDFEAYVENFNDTMPERLAQEWASSWADTLKIVPQTLDLLNKIYDPEHEESQITKTLTDTSAQLREYAFAGANQFQTWNLQALGSLMPMINSMMVGSLLPVNTEVFTNVTLGISSGAETTKRRLEEGCDVTTSVINGALHGVITGMVEGLNAGAITELFTGSPQKWLMSIGLMAKASPTAVAGMLASMGVSEATEEFIESLADVVADNVQNFILGDAVGRINADTIDPADMANEMAMAFVGTLFLGAGTATNVVINTKQKYNSAMQVRAHCESVIESPIAMEEEKAVARRVIQEIDYATQPYIQTSETAMAVDLPSDQVAPMASYNELMNNLANAMQPDVQTELATAEQTLKYANQVKADLQNSLVERGMNIDVNRFLDMDSNKRTQYMNMAKSLSDSGIRSAFTQMFSGQNGLSVGDGVIINTDQTRTLDIDALADLDDKVADNAIKKGGNEIFKEAGSNASAESATAHEITHYAERSGMWENLRNTIRDLMGEQRFEKAKTRLEQIYKSRGVENVNAEKEAVAFYIQKNFGNQQFLNRMAKYSSSMLSRMLANARSYFEGGSLAKLENMFMKAVVESKNIVDVAVKNGSVAPVSASIGTWEKTDVDALVEAIKDELNKDKTLGSEEVTSEDVQKWVDSVSSVAKMVADDIDRLGYVSNSTYSAMKSNSDYKYTIDMSTLCKKRLLLQGTIDAVQKAMPNTALTSMDYITIRELMAKKGLEVSCGFCYVESARRLLGKVAEEFLETSGHTDVSIADLITVDGVENLQRTNPKVYEEFVKFNNARGQQRAMLVQTRTEYRGEIRNLTEKAVADLIKNGGLRLQSYSDFETPHLIDMMQVVLDMASKGLTSQAYTKVPNFADAFGNTNIKINLSLVCKGLDENGELIFDDVEGMPHEDAFRLREKYSKNVGTILVGKDDATILSAMADPRIDYIIPFHRSGWAKNEFEALGITGYDNYTDEQHEKLITPVRYEITQGKNKGKLSDPTRNPKDGDILPLDYWDFSKSGRENAVTYLELCREQGRIPKFSRFLEHHGTQKVDENGEPMFVTKGKNKGQPIYEDEYWTLQPDGSTDGYWKTLIDFKMYDNDGVGSPQERVVPIFDDEVNRRILNEYQGGHRTLRSAEDVVQEFLRMKNPESRYSLGFQGNNDYDADNYPIPEKLVEMMKGTRLTNGMGQLLRIYHTSRDLFSKFDPREADHYRFGDQVVNYYSTSRDVSGSYAGEEGFSTVVGENSYGSALKQREETLSYLEEYRRLSDERDKIQSGIDDSLRSFLDGDDVQTALKTIKENIDSVESSDIVDLSDDDYAMEEISTDIRQIINSPRPHSYNARFEQLLGLYDVLDDGTYTTDWGVEYKLSQKLRDMMSPLASISEKMWKLYAETEAERGRAKELDDKAFDAFKSWESARDSLPSIQYVGYGKTKNPYILEGEIGINGTNTNWNSINDTTYKFKSYEVDMDNILQAIFDMADKNSSSYKQERAEKILNSVNKENREYMLKNPIFLANLSVIFDDYALSSIDVLGDVRDKLNNRLESDGFGEEFNDRFDEVYDTAVELAQLRGYEPVNYAEFEQVDWDEALEVLRIPKENRFTNRLETNDVVKAVLAINNYIKNNGLDFEPYDGVIFKSITDSGNGDFADTASDIVALFNSNQFKLATNKNPTLGPDIRFALGEQIAPSAKKAVEEFGTTDDFNKAGYILSDGSLLDLSEGQDRRVQDHRSVGFVYDDIDYGRDGMSAGLIRFMNEGNVRILPESGSVDISSVAEPTNAQYRQIANFLRNYRGEWHALDISYEDGAKVFSMQYPPFTPVSRVIDDIKNYFADGTIPEMDTDSLYQYALGDEAVPANADGGNDIVPPTRVEGEVVDGYGKRKTQRFASSNIPKSDIFNESQKQRVDEEIKNGLFTYISSINKVEIQRAREWMERDGVEKTLKTFMENDRPDMKSVVMGTVLVQQLAQNDDPRWHDVAVKLADDATVAGQFLQAYAIMQKLTPEGQLMSLRRAMRRMQNDINNRFGNKAPQLELNPELEEEMRNAKTQEEREDVARRIRDDLQSQIPTTVRDWLNSWRYLAMLGNPRTHVRNVVGNGVFVPAITMKNAIGTALESVFGKNLDYKTKAVLNRFSEADRALLELGGKEYEVYKSAIEKTQSKYERKSFPDKGLGKLLNWMSNKNSKAMDKADFWFAKARFSSSFAQFLKANGLTADTTNSEMISRANAYAIREALRATYRDANSVADWLNELENSNKEGLKMASYVKDALIPFTKTPMNIIKRGVRYSPVGLAYTVTRDLKKLHDGKITANDFLDNLAQGLTGTSIAVLGAWLASLGLFRTKDDDKDRKQYFDSENGEQDYAIDLSPLGIKGTYTVDWATPVIMPFAIGAELFDVFADLEGVDGFDDAISAVADISAKIMDPVMETSMLSSLQDALKSYSTSGGAWLGDMVMSMASSYILQMFPTFGGQLARTIDDTRRTTYPNNGALDKLFKQINNKIPWRSQLNEPYINRKGQEEKTEGGNMLGRAFLNMFSPGYYSSKETDGYDDELYRLYDSTGELDAFPSSSSNSITFEKEKFNFSGKEYTEWHKKRWQTEDLYVNQFIDSQAYKNLSDEERVKTIKDIRGYAQKVAKRQFLESKGYTFVDSKEEYEERLEKGEKVVYDKELANANGAVDNGIELYAFYDYLNNGGTKQAEKVQYLNGTNLTKAQKEYLWGLSDYKTSYEAVYRKVFGGSGNSSSKRKKSSSGSKSGSKKKVTGSAGGINKVSGGGATKKINYSPMASNPAGNSSVVNNFFRAYANTFKRGSKNVSSASSNTIVCPRCGNRVSANMNRCPICGASL